MKRFYSAIFLLVSFSAFAQRPEASFGVNGRVVVPSVDSLFDLVTQPDGKILGLGYTQVYSRWGIFRLNTDGTMDQSFGNGGTVSGSISNEWGHTLAIQPDGKIILAGDSGLPSKVAVLRRFMPDGSTDVSFGNAGKVSKRIDSLWVNYNSVLIQPDGKIMAGGVRVGQDQLYSIPHLMIDRYNTDGTLDSTFHIPTVRALSNYTGPNIRLQPDGKILTSDIYRFNTNGTLDSLFGINGYLNLRTYVISDLRVQSNGGILVQSRDATRAYRITSSGRVDSAFGLNGLSADTCPSGVTYGGSLVILPDGSFLTSGTNSHPIIARHDSTGHIMPGFGYQGYQVFNDSFPDLQGFIMATTTSGQLTAGGARYNGGPVVVYLYRDLDLPSGIADVADEQSQIYPNPAVGQISIRSKQHTSHIRITDITGKPWIDSDVENTTTHQIDVTGLCEGTYVVTIKSVGQTQHCKLTIVR
ncbi:MAG: T9SS type A sorting domain-containing protein [Bacteroidetes bacterium]|nr:T9SS type A sorting domain-containing protein [Bacteroidota bacterium]